MKVINRGYEKKFLGYKPLFLDNPHLLVVRFNVHYPVDIFECFGKPIEEIKSRAILSGFQATSCLFNPFRPPAKTAEAEQDRVKNLGFAFES